LPGSMFVHVRVKKYREHHDVQVISLGRERTSLVYEGVPVEICANPEQVLAVLAKGCFDRLIIHFFQPWMLDSVVRKMTSPILIWVHAYEGLGWYRRLFDAKIFTKNFALGVFLNSKQQLNFRRLIHLSNESRRIRFVFVSKWAKKTVQRDTMSGIQNATIIPNPIDTEVFGYKPRPAEFRFRVLLFRSFKMRKYANDISAKAILRLSKTTVFPSFHFTILGHGRLFSSTVECLRGLSNVHLSEGVLPTHTDVAKLHNAHGVFLCPTREDAQGVSMCEAMASGLVPITSNNSAIPEFVRHGESGLLTRNARQIAEALETLAREPGLFEKLSKGAAESIRAKCALRDVIDRELELIEGFTG
jgi:glycosyltransferase involved in cell wall biosynthesis